MAKCIIDNLRCSHRWYREFFAAQSKAAQLVTLDGMSAVDLTDEDVNRYLDEREDGLSQKTIALKEDGMDEKSP